MCVKYVDMNCMIEIGIYVFSDVNVQLMHELICMSRHMCIGMAVDRGKAGIRPNPPRLDWGWTIRIGRWTYTGIPV